TPASLATSPSVVARSADALVGLIATPFDNRDFVRWSSLTSIGSHPSLGTKGFSTIFRIMRRIGSRPAQVPGDPLNVEQEKEKANGHHQEIPQGSGGGWRFGAGTDGCSLLRGH